MLLSRGELQFVNVVSSIQRNASLPRFLIEEVVVTYKYLLLLVILMVIVCTLFPEISFAIVSNVVKL